MRTNIWLLFALWPLSLVNALSISIQASPNTVGASPALLSLMMVPEQKIPVSGGLRLTLPTQFNSAHFGCKVLEPRALSLKSCTLQNSKRDAVLVLDDPLPAFSQVFLEIAGAVNPSSTSQNRDYVMSSFNASQLTLETASGLSLLQLAPAPLTAFSVTPGSDMIGAVTWLDI